MSDNDIQRLLHFDPLSAAEKLAGGESYKESPAVMNLGMAIALGHNARKEAALKATGDTYFASSFAETREVYVRLGFTEILETHFDAPSYDGGTYHETSIVLWREDGVLGRIETYMGDHLNTNKFYYNWRPNPELREHGLWGFTSSGHLKDGVWVGDHDGREGMAHNLTRMAANGQFVNPWIESPFLWFVTYDEPEGDYDYKAINASVIAQLPENVRQAMAA